MKSLPSRILLVALVPVILGGCSSLFGERFAGNRQIERSNIQPRQGQDKSGTTASATEAGRTMLAAGMPGKAIEAFQRALASGEPVAPALNGMGVAYARIGRTDLAVRYFRQASATEPQNSQFAQNLDRMMQLAASARTDQARQAAHSSNADNPSSGGVQSDAIASRSAPRSVRSEIRIVTRAGSGQTANERASLATRFQPLVRIEFAQARTADVVERRIDVSNSFKPIIRVKLEEARRVNQPNVQVAVASSKPAK